jgi:hypothetical protein
MRVDRRKALHGFREFGVEFGDVRVVAFGFFEIRAAVEHAVEFVDEQGHGLVAFVGGDGGVEIRAVDTDVAFGRKPIGDGLLGVAFKLDADADDALFVSEQAFCFILNEGFEGRGEFEVNAGDDQFVLMGMSVHVTLVCCWID